VTRFTKKRSRPQYFRAAVVTIAACGGLVAFASMIQALQVLLWVGAFLAVYSYLFYPVLLMLLQRRARAPGVWTTAPSVPTVTVIVAARNEQARKLGAAFELAAHNLKWLAAHGTTGLETATGAFERLSEANKTFILKGARATHSRRPFDSAPLFDSMAAEWEGGMAALQASL
jgi:Domain of unknown function (DUF1839)